MHIQAVKALFECHHAYLTYMFFFFCLFCGCKAILILINHIYLNSANKPIRAICTFGVTVIAWISAAVLIKFFAPRCSRWTSSSSGHMIWLDKIKQRESNQISRSKMCPLQEVWNDWFVLLVSPEPLVSSLCPWTQDLYSDPLNSRFNTLLGHCTPPPHCANVQFCFQSL